MRSWKFTVERILWKSLKQESQHQCGTRSLCHFGWLLMMFTVQVLWSVCYSVVCECLHDIHVCVYGQFWFEACISLEINIKIKTVPVPFQLHWQIIWSTRKMNPGIRRNCHDSLFCVLLGSARIVSILPALAPYPDGILNEQNWSLWYETPKGSIKKLCKKKKGQSFQPPNCHCISIFYNILWY